MPRSCASPRPPTSYALFILLPQIVCCHFAFVPPGCAGTFNFVQHDDGKKRWPVGVTRSVLENENIAERQLKPTILKKQKLKQRGDSKKVVNSLQ